MSSKHTHTSLDQDITIMILYENRNEFNAINQFEDVKEKYENAMVPNKKKHRGVNSDLLNIPWQTGQ